MLSLALYTEMSNPTALAGMFWEYIYEKITKIVLA